MSRVSNSLGVFIFGFLGGLFIMGITVWLLMPSFMLVLHESKFSTVEETCSKLSSSIEAQGWSSPGLRDLNKTIEKHGLHLERPVKLIELCKATYAKDILESNPEVSTLMPCAWGVFKGDDGKVYITGMNMGLMGKMFRGNISRIMGGFVAQEEKAILKEVIVEKHA